ncbi:hypothetical protein HED50_15705 [Ochrobactrum oryzae]|nr:hypothetical protein [Brucella oryzae]
MAKQNTGSNGHQYLHIKMLVKGIGLRGSAAAPVDTAIMMSSVWPSMELRPTSRAFQSQTPADRAAVDGIDCNVRASSLKFT